MQFTQYLEYKIYLQSAETQHKSMDTFITTSTTQTH